MRESSQDLATSRRSRRRIAPIGCRISRDRGGPAIHTFISVPAEADLPQIGGRDFKKAAVRRRSARRPDADVMYAREADDA
jgi:hypothetical protein